MAARKRNAARGGAAVSCRRNSRLRSSPGFPLPFFLAFSLLSVFLLASCGGGKAGGDRVKVAADIVPLAQICRSVGGEWVEVEVMVPPGASPHGYELTSEQVRSLADADLLVMVDLGLIPWEKDIFTRIGREDLAVVEAGEEIPDGELVPAGEVSPGEGAEGPEEEEGRGPYDPHVWLDPVLVKHIVEAVGEGLAGIDPEHASAYRANAAAFLAELEELHAEITRRTAAFSRREFMAFHSSWTYFARRYGLLQVGVIEERPGKEPSAGEIAELVELAREKGVGAIFAEEQFSARVAEAVAEESGGEVRVWKLDPLGDLGHPEKGDYCGLMRYNLSVMEEALR